MFLMASVGLTLAGLAAGRAVSDAAIAGICESLTMRNSVRCVELWFECSAERRAARHEVVEFGDPNVLADAWIGPHANGLVHENFVGATSELRHGAVYESC